MKHLYLRRTLILLGSALLAVAPLLAAKPLAKPAEIEIEVAPSTIAAGDEAQITLQLEPIDGVKINRYPKITLVIGEAEGLHGASRAELGNSTPPPPDKMDTNYFKTVDPLKLTLPFAGAAPAGRHEIAGKLTYFYCVTASGFCAPKRVDVTIPVEIR